MAKYETNGVLDQMQTGTKLEWKIFDIFSLPSGEKYGCVCQHFNFANITWVLGLQISQVIKFFLTRRSRGPPITLHGIFSLKKVDLKIEDEIFNYTFGNGSSYCCTFRRVIDRSDLEKRQSVLLPLGVFTIVCTLQVGNLNVSSTKFTEFPTLSKDFKKLLTDGKNFDVTLKVGDKEFQAHRSVLVARSPVFSAMLEHNMLEKETGVISIADCDPDSFGVFLQYLYSGEIEDFCVTSAADVYCTAHKYDVKELKSFCARCMRYNVTEENVCFFATMAEQYEEKALLSAAQAFFNRNFGKIVVTAGWETLMKNNFRLGNKLIVEMLKVQNSTSGSGTSQGK